MLKNNFASGLVAGGDGILLSPNKLVIILFALPIMILVFPSLGALVSFSNLPPNSDSDFSLHSKDVLTMLVGEVINLTEFGGDKTDATPAT